MLQYTVLFSLAPSFAVSLFLEANPATAVSLQDASSDQVIEMISKPDAALIKNPGRLYLQVGYDEIYVNVQSGYSGAEYVPTSTYIPDEEIAVQMIDNTANPIHSAKLDLAEA